MRIEAPGKLSVNALVALAVVLPWTILNWNIDLNLADEGYLWYGAWRTSMGEVPMRDFQAYDPGRYYMMAPWFRMLGPGIAALRIGEAFVQWLGLTIGLYAVGKVVTRTWGLLLFSQVIFFWDISRYKAFETMIALSAISMALWLFERQTLRRYLASGIFVGFAAFMGRNHGLYNLVAFALFITCINAVQPGQKGAMARNAGSFLIGVFVGYLPMLLMFLAIPDFFRSFMEITVHRISRFGEASLPIVMPWDGSASKQEIIARSLLIVMPFWYLGIFMNWIRSFRQHMDVKAAAILASACVGLPYIHHAVQRADLEHISQSIAPMIAGIFMLGSLSGSGIRRLAARGLLVFTVLISIVLAYKTSPFIDNLKDPDKFVAIDIGGSSVHLPDSVARDIAGIKELSGKYVKEGEKFLVVPNRAGIYVVMDQKSPTRWLYYFFSLPEDWQMDLIEQIRRGNVSLALIREVAYDGKEYLLFRNTHPLIWKYLNEDFELIDPVSVSDDIHVFKRKG